MYAEITNDPFLKPMVEHAIHSGEVHKFLSDVLAGQPAITVVVEKRTPGLREALNTLAHASINVVEFRTYVREKTSMVVHAHLFEPLCQPAGVGEPELPPPPRLPPHPPRGSTKAPPVTFRELIDAGLLKDGEVLFFYNTRLFADERARVIASSNQLEYEADRRTYSKSKLAGILLTKHGFRHGDYPVRGPTFWRTEGDKSLSDLEKEVRIEPIDRD